MPIHPSVATSPSVTPVSLLWTQWGSVSTGSPDWRVNFSHCVYAAASKFRGLDSSCNNFCFLARIQNLDGNDKRPEQETDIISQESSVRSSTPRKNGSVLNFESPVSKGTRIQTISQSVPQTVPSADVARPVNATPTTSTSLTPAPSVSSVQKPRNDHITNRQDRVRIEMAFLPAAPWRTCVCLQNSCVFRLSGAVERLRNF